MSRHVGIVASSNKAVVVDLEILDADEVEIQNDHTWNLQTGDRAQALNILYQRSVNYLKENNIDRVHIKASAVPMSGAKKAHLESAEVRGVIIAAAASVCEVSLVTKSAISRSFGTRKADEYIGDNDFWSDRITIGKLRAGSREAALLVLAGVE